MRFFNEETGGKASKETIIIISHDEALIIVEAINEFIKNNPRKTKAKKLLNEMDKKWRIY